MLHILKFIRITLRHKVLVFRFGLRTKAPLFRLIIHDWTKLSPAELIPYTQRHFGLKDDPIAFATAWNHHHKSNPHHWEYFIPVTSHQLSNVPAGEPLPMPEWAIREMVADWLAASTKNMGRQPRTLDDWQWYQDNRSVVRLHPESRMTLERVVADYFERYGQSN